MRNRKKGERSNGYPNDVMAPDGIPEYGWRKVRKGGIVKFAGDDYQHDALLSFVGQFVCVKTNCYWMTDVQAWTDYPNMAVKHPICVFENKPLPIFTEDKGRVDK